MSPQAREDIISLLKSDRTRPETLEAHYGSSVPTKALQALQRDGLLTLSANRTEDVYEKPMAEVRRHISYRTGGHRFLFCCWGRFKPGTQILLFCVLDPSGSSVRT